MKRKLICILIIFSVFLSFPSFADELDYLHISKKVNILLKNIYVYVSQNNKGNSLENLGILLKTLDKERENATRDGESQIIDLLREIYSIGRKIKNNIRVPIKRIKNLAIETNETLAVHYDYLAEYYRQKNQKTRYEYSKRLARTARVNSLKWSNKRNNDLSTKDFEDIINDVKKNSFGTVGKTFKNINNGVNRVLGIERFGRRNEVKVVKEPGFWD